MCPTTYSLGYEDAFGKLIADGTTNEIDIASHYPYNPERWRLFVGGTRQFPEYGSVSQYNHASDVHELKPASGETVVLQTAERPRYVVQYELNASWACAINQSLASGDQIRIGLFDDNDGWFLEHNGDHADDKTVDLVVKRSGSEKVRTSHTLPKPITNFTRLELRTAWYNIARQLWKQTYTSNGVQKNREIGRTSIDDGTKGPAAGNLPLRFEVTASGSTSGLVLEAGSTAIVTEGSVSGITREKTAEIKTSDTTIDATGTWVPIAAIRRDTNRKIISTEITDITIAEFTGSGDVRLMAIAVDASETDASGFSTPPEHNSTNSVVEQTQSVTTFPDNSGTVGGSASNPGGYQLGYAALYTSGQGSKTENERLASAKKRSVADDDVIVLIANATAQGDITLNYTVEQDW